MQKNLNQIKKIINAHSDIIKYTYKVKNIGVFGSIARGDNTKVSDVDLLVELSEPLSFFRFIDLENYLSQIIGAKVDLVTKKALKPIIKEEILQEVVYV